jgi:hypothetical protein
MKYSAVPLLSQTCGNISDISFSHVKAIISHDICSTKNNVLSDHQNSEVRVKNTANVSKASVVIVSQISDKGQKMKTEQALQPVDRTTHCGRQMVYLNLLTELH